MAIAADAIPMVIPLSAGSIVRNETSEFAVLDVEEIAAARRTRLK